MEKNETASKAIDEISEILKKHDLAGYVLLGTEAGGKYQIYLPTWSALQCEDALFSFDPKDTPRSLVYTLRIIEMFREMGNKLSHDSARMEQMLWHYAEEEEDKN